MVMNHSQQRQYSLGYFNIARGFGTVIVILGHSMALFLDMLPAAESPTVFAHAGRVVGGGVMAMFFLISGFYFQKRTPRMCFVNQWKLLMKPYYVTGAAIFLGLGLRSILQGYSFKKQAIQTVMTFLLGMNASRGGMVFGLPVGTVSIFWYVLALFWGWNLLNWISRFQSRNLRLAVFVLCVTACWIMAEISSVWVMAIPISLLAVVYIALGYEIRRNHLLERKLPGWMWAGILAVTVVCLAFGNVDIAACKWKLGVLDMLGSLCIGFLILRLYKEIMDKISGKHILGSIEHVGMNSMRILCLHALEKEVLPWRDIRFVFPDQPYLCFLICMIGRVLVINLMLQVVILFRRAYRKLMRPVIVISDDTGADV